MITLAALLLALPLPGPLTRPLTQDVAPPAPLEPVPSARQLAWHARGYNAHVQLGSDSGEASELDCEQWVRVWRGAGMSGVVVSGVVPPALEAACRAAGWRLSPSLEPDVDRVVGGLSSDTLWTAAQGGERWVPTECDASIRPSRFYVPEEDERVKSIEELEELWYATVGRGANLLLNVPIDGRGLVHEIDAERLGELSRVIRATFRKNLAPGASAAADVVRGGADAFAAGNVLDRDPETYWATEDATRAASLTLTFPAPITFDRVLLREPVALGQRIAEFRVFARNGRNEAEIARGTTIGYRLHLRTPITTADEVRLEIRDARAAPLLSELLLYLSPPVVTVDPPEADFMGELRVRLRCTVPTSIVRYTLDGSEPTAESPAYKKPLELTASAELRARVFTPEGPGARLCTGSYRAWDASRLRPSVHFFRKPDSGLGYAYYEGDWTGLAGIGDAGPVRRGAVPLFDASVAGRTSGFALRFSGHFFAPHDGIYTFWTTSSDGSELWIGDERIVANDGRHAALERLGRIGLQAGFHPIRVDYFNAQGSTELKVEGRGPQSERRVVPASALYR